MTGRHSNFPEQYYHDADLRLIQLVPPDTRRILDIRCGQGFLGEMLKHLEPTRHIVGLTDSRESAGVASRRLDKTIVCDIEKQIEGCESNTFDCIIAADALAYCADPLAVLSRLRPLLQPGGHLIASLPNIQHWSMIDALCRGDFQYHNRGLLDHGHRRFFGFANINKLFLDAGFLPCAKDRRELPAPPGWLQSMHAATERQGLDQAAFTTRVQTYEYFIDALLIDGLPLDLASNTAPISIAACTNDATVLDDNLLASPCLNTGEHETLLIKGAGSAAEGLNAAIEQARHPLVVLAHQDVYLPQWWIHRLWQQYEAACAGTGREIGIMGVYGVRGTSAGVMRSGRVVDRDYLLNEATTLPAEVSSLDELVLIVPRQSPIRFDPALGFHLYGTDACLQANALDYPAMVIDAPCFHNSKQGNQLPEAFTRSKAVLREKWKARLPIMTPCDIIS